MLIVPTGIGASIGGYAGDAIPIARCLSSVCDRLITHPNVMNGAQLYWAKDNIFYVEGYALDKFAQGDWALKPVHQNRIGLILDQGIEADLRLRHLQTADGCRATLGLDIPEYIITDQPINVELRTSETGISWGTIGNPDSLLRAAEKLIFEAKVSAIAIVVRFPDEVDQNALQSYRYGEGVDILAGAEAVISHLLVRQFKIPVAHAPALSPLPIDDQISPRSCAEELGYTFLTSVLVGLSKAPQFVTEINNISTNSNLIYGSDLDALIIPASACGGSAVLSLSNSNTKIIAVEENETSINVTPESLGIKAIRVKSYLEAIGILVAYRNGVSIDYFNPKLPQIKNLEN